MNLDKNALHMLKEARSFLSSSDRICDEPYDVQSIVNAATQARQATRELDILHGYLKRQS